MPRTMNRWGVGPRILVSVLGYGALAGIATWLWPEVCLIRVVPYSVFATLGIVLLALGVPMLIAAGRAATVAFNQDQLATEGIFAIVRNPIYSAWIVFLIPGFVMFSRSWPVLLTPLVGYAVFKAMIRKENECLEERFGQAYLNYRASVNELIPFLRFGGPRP